MLKLNSSKSYVGLRTTDSSWSSGAPFVTSDLSSDAKVILCHKLHEDIKPAGIAAADLKYGAQQATKRVSLKMARSG